MENPISGLTLNDRLEKHRKEIIYQIKQNISVGLMNGDRYSTMARRMKTSLNDDYKKAIRIVRTEAHRVREAGNLDAALSVENEFRSMNSNMQMLKTWRTMKDERVRPAKKTKSKSKKTKKKVRTKKSSKIYDHRSMEGVQILVEEEFELPSGARTKAPGQSGAAGEDINCRCYLSYDIKEDTKELFRENENVSEQETSWDIEEEELYYREVQINREESNIEYFQRQGYRVEAYKVNDSPYNLYFSTQARKPKRSINYYENLIKQIEKDMKLDLTGMEKPRYVIVSGMTEMKAGTIAAYSPASNTIFLRDNTNKNRLVVQIQKAAGPNYYACADDARATLMHESMHWYRLQYAKKKRPEDIRGFIEEQNKRIIDHINKVGYNIKNDISVYAGGQYGFQNVDELIAEALTKFHYGKSNKLISFLIKEMTK